ncbi:rho GTPase-activating protein gacK-like isoform X2 [Episyrphus balteatus]|uniref:rho GTPase-activating protein gacK-like isoform X2 n=1 Tax=Episyrphus balteatus TaxID=286459 RepID=UPI0024867A5B|nr:rho GTPase-activating protein gacK-like isoform X2 [Episyrphus balteatus]
MDNTVEFINVVKRYDAIYNVGTPEYKNFEAKGRAWHAVAEEVGVSVDAAKRKWKNLRDSYTKYLRSFRIGTKTSKKYQFWAHADHMEFLKPHQGPGRPQKQDDNDENDSDIGFQVLKKVTIAEDSVLAPPPPPPLPLPLPQITTATLTPSTPAKVHIQPSFILAKNISNGYITQIPTTPLDLACNTTPTLTSPIVAKIRAINNPAPFFTNNLSTIPEITSSSVATLPPPPKIRKIAPQNNASINVDNFDVTSILRANREMDSTCLFFLSLAKSVRTMPKRYQAMVKMRCMQIINDAEVEIESNFDCDETGGFISKQQQQQNGTSKNTDNMDNANNDSNSQAASGVMGQPTNNSNENSEHFMYVMSPSRVETMIDVSSEDETTNGTNNN